MESSTNLKIREFFKSEYNKTSSFQKTFESDIAYVQTSKSKHWNKIFHDELAKFLARKGICKSSDSDLKQLHSTIDEKYLGYQTVGQNNNSRPIIADIVFDFIADQEDLYHEFMKWIHDEVIKEDFFFQKIPTVRFHAPGAEGNLSLPAWHSDSFLGHNPREYNIWFGITENDCSDFWVQNFESSKRWFSELEFNRELWKSICFSGDKNFMSIGYKNASEAFDIYNSILMFDSRCIHAAAHRSHRDPTTKISIDVRLILVKDFEWKLIDGFPVFHGDGIRKAEFRPGSAFGYHEKTIKELMK